VCGIAGIVDVARRPVPPSLVGRMAGCLAHRGPDDEGYLLVERPSGRRATFGGADTHPAVAATLPPLGAAELAPDVAFGHRRFSIIDPSPAGHQPFVDADETCAVVFNGEIYNYIELRAELEAAGARFRTDSDTEVLVEAYKRWGPRCFERFNGFWALALYEFGTGRVLLSRDRLGKKPLFWARAGSTVYFASEIKALLSVPEVGSRRRVNEAAAFQWLAYGRKDLNGASCFEGVRAFPAGAWAAIDEAFDGEGTRFWEAPRRRLAERDIGADEAAARLRALLTDAVQLRLRADVPVAVELSGGMDSSTLVALAAGLSARRVTTYTVRFPEPRWNEEPYARAVAERFGVDYRVLESPSADFWGRILAFTRLEEEPYHAPNLQTNQVIWAQMRAQGTKVSLNGAAGDEVFAGYGGYYAPAQAENLLRGRFGVYARNAWSHSEGTGRVRALSSPVGALVRATAKRTVGGALVRARGAPRYLRGLTPAVSPAGGRTLSQALREDLTNALIPYWLTSGDRGCMGVPVEVRAPFLDYRVVDFAFTLPTSYLVRDGWHKWLLRKAMEDVLPADVVWRRRKLGFPFPVERFYASSAPLIDLLFARAENPYVDTAAAGAPRRDWRVISFLLWYELFFNENTALFRELEAMAPAATAGAGWGYLPQYLRAGG
jgi:asparagine synthase (glutamine-hydrolysing)